MTEGRIFFLHAAKLKAALEGFHAQAEQRAAFAPALRGYAQFEEALGFFAGAACGGCRADKRCGVPGCAAKSCAAERGVGFCGECSEFPCDRNRCPDELAARWKAMGERIAEKGAVAWYEEQASRPRC